MIMQHLSAVLNELHLEDINNPDHPSHYVSISDYSMLILRLPTFKNHRLQAYNQIFIFHQKAIYRFDMQNQTFEFLSNDIMDLYSYLDKAVDRAISILESYGDEVLALEESLYQKSAGKKFIDIWFELKKDLTRIERIYLRAYGVLKSFIKENDFSDDVKTKFLDIEEHLDRAQRSVGLHLAKLDTVYNYYQSIKNDKLNQTLYTLTVISAIFLPLNLLVGFFGINTTDLFFTEDSGGTYKVIYLLIGTLLAMLVAIPLLVKIYEKTFGRLLNRYEFYKKLTQKIKDFKEQ
jgi:magnesium transporter